MAWGYIALRGIIAFLGFSVLLGNVWFSDSLNGFVLLAGIVLGANSLIAAFVPEPNSTTKKTQRVVVALCVVGLGAGLILVINDLRASGNIEWHVLAIRGLHLALLAVMAIKNFNRKPA